MTNEHIISADSHVNPSKDLWTREAPASLAGRECGIGWIPYFLERMDHTRRVGVRVNRWTTRRRERGRALQAQLRDMPVTAKRQTVSRAG